jgi:predicted dehydrogenase
MWDRTLGGGALLDLGIYPLATAPWIFGAFRVGFYMKCARAAHLAA